ncbi:MAG: OmpW family outer membrane protein [Burkholderiales bacterium]
MLKKILGATLIVGATVAATGVLAQAPTTGAPAPTPATAAPVQTTTKAMSTDPYYYDRAGPWYGNVLVRLRVVNIDPDASNSATAGGAIPEDSISIDNRWAAELDISYFFTPNFALELVLTYPQKHDVSITSGPLEGSIGSIKQLPPSLYAQWHFPFANGFKPYVGAGITYFWITSNDLIDGVNIRTSNWGWGLQAGVDYALNRNWYLNADVKKIWVDTKVTDSLGLGVDARLEVDPWVYGVGVGYRF